MITAQQAAQELLNRREARRSFTAWCKLLGFMPAKHHQLIIDVLQAITEAKPVSEYPKLCGVLLRVKPDLDLSKPLLKVMLLMPPGSAKSTYTSKAFPAWFLGKRINNCILSCSYAKDLVVGFGRAARNYVQQYENVLGYSLSKDSTAADEWQTSTNGRYFCAGVGAGIAGHRADLGLIDDPVGSEEDADSKAYRDKLASWYVNDFIPRLKPNAAIVLIANRRHEEDLCGMLLNRTKDHPNGLMGDADEWLVLRIPFFADEPNDVLGRKIGEPLWPEYFNESFTKTVAKMPPRTKAGLYQQKPSPESGDYFKADWLCGYEQQDLPHESELRLYVVSDHAISKQTDANDSCFIVAGVDSNSEIWVLPYIFKQRADSAEQVEAMLRMARRYRPVAWVAEKVHITQSIGPFLRKRMRETNTYFNLHEVVPKKDKLTRARSIQGRMSLKMVHFPKFADWWGEVEHELLSFPNGKTDDFVDCLAHLGMYLDRMTAGELVIDTPEPLDASPVLDFRWLKAQNRRQKYAEMERQDA